MFHVMNIQLPPWLVFYLQGRLHDACFQQPMCQARWPVCWGICRQDVKSWSWKKPAALHDYVKKYVFAYISSLAVAYHHGPFPVFCPVGKTQLLGMNPVVECLAFMHSVSSWWELLCYSLHSFLWILSLFLNLVEWVDLKLCIGHDIYRWVRAAPGGQHAVTPGGALRSSLGIRFFSPLNQ